MKRSNILVIAGHDPSGGAGIQADIESASANGVHAASVITVLTCQDTANVHALWPVDTDFFAQCLETAATDMQFAAIKVGVVANPAQVDVVGDIARRLPDVPLVVDPVLKAAGGASLADDVTGMALRERLFRLADVITPNADEARLLCDGEPDIERCGARLSGYGCDVLITGGDEQTDDVVNRWFAGGECRYRARWPRLPGVFHGSGCTLASALAAELARGSAMGDALQAAQDYTWHTLEHAFAAGRGQAIPDRPARVR